MGKLTINTTPMDGVVVIETNPFIDDRGEWGRLFCQDELKDVIKTRQIVNINLSKTLHKGTIRGMHYQLPPMSEMKLIRCLHGTIIDIALDLRPNSKTYLKWHGEILSDDNQKMIVIPEGFAHGFQALSNNVEMLYLHTQYYSPELERGIRYNDPMIGIKWPLPPIFLSERDKAHPLISSDFSGCPITTDGD